MVDSKIKISVIIPVYNAEIYLSQCLESVVNQTLKELEIICIDDNSRDNSIEILTNFKNNDERIILLKNKKQIGAGESRNLGIKIANGEYIHFLDSDDYLVPDAYEILYNKAVEYNLDLIKAKAYSVDALTSEEVSFPRYDMLNLKPNDYEVVTDFYKDPKKLSRLPVTPWSGFYRRSFLVNNNITFNNLISVNDRSFLTNVYIKAKAIMCMDYFILYYRVNTPGSLIGIRAQHFECLFKSYNIIKDQCVALSQSERFHILESAIYDMFYWYRKYQKEHILEKEIYAKTKAFIDDLDVSVFGDILCTCRWYYDYMNIKGIKQSLLCKIKRIVTNICLIVLRVFRYSRAYGLKSTFRLAKRKVRIKNERKAIWTYFK